MEDYNRDFPFVCHLFQVIAVGTFVVAKLFFGVFDMAVDTLFLCFCKYIIRNCNMENSTFTEGLCGIPIFKSRGIRYDLKLTNKEYCARKYI